jgi:dihydrodipicolinate reductase
VTRIDVNRVLLAAVPNKDRFEMPHQQKTDSPSGVAGLSQRAVFVSQMNELWAEILPTAEKRLRVNDNKTLGW